MSEEIVVETDEVIETEDVSQKDNIQEDQGDGADQQDDPEGGSEEVKVYLSGDDSGAQPTLMNADQVNDVVQRRLARNNRSHKKRDDEAAELEAKNAVLEEQNALLHQIASQKQTAELPKRPIASDYSEGEDDSRFLADDGAYIRGVFQEEIQKSNAQQVDRDESTQQSLANKRRFDSNLKVYAEQSAQIKVSDFEVKEDAAVETFGQDGVDQIINLADNKALVVYYLGANPVVAQKLVGLMRTDPDRAFRELLKIDNRVMSGKKAPSQRAPDPDEERPGSGVPSSTGGAPGAKYW